MAYTGKYLTNSIEIEKNNRYFATYQLTTGTICPKCSAPIVLAIGQKCTSCMNLSNINRVYAMGFYHKGIERDELSRHILDLKHNMDMAEPLGLALAITIQHRYPALLSADIIIPVPMHETKLELTGYNQAQQLAKNVGIELKKNVLDCMIQKKNFSQHEASRVERFSNVKNAFTIDTRAKVRLKGRHVIIIDDIMTSGATLDECAKVLINNGTRQVDGLVLGRTV